MYIYSADFYCDSCGREICKNLGLLGHHNQGDSDSWPQHHPDGGESDSPNHCAGNAKCLEAVDLYDWGLTANDTLYGAESSYVGVLLSEDLTEEGINYVKEMADHYKFPSNGTPYQRALNAYWKETFNL